MHTRKKGFTIIEVVLVLAIAGLIFLAVFIALPALQRNQRNTQRLRDLALIVAQMDTFRVHNANRSVSDNISYAFNNDSTAIGFCTFYNKYVSDEVVDPSTGTPYKVSLNKATRAVDCKADGVERPKYVDRGGYDPDVVGRSGSRWAKMEVGDIQYNDVAKCDGEIFNDQLNKSSGMHIFAIRIQLEGGATACQDNGGTPISNTLETTPYSPISAFGIVK
jgi:prepilin-type N-terminal cleavage/methylation domain-containing protein